MVVTRWRKMALWRNVSRRCRSHCEENFVGEHNLLIFAVPIKGGGWDSSNSMCGSINDSRAMQHLGLHYEYLDQLPSLVLWKTRGLCLGNVSSQSGLLIKYFQILLSFCTKWGGSAAGEVEHCIRTSESESWLSEDAISAQFGIQQAGAIRKTSHRVS